jgi:tetratricopeptide (TPR) repeat protein
MRLRSAVFFFAAAALVAACSGYGRSDQSAAQLAFGVDMARRGLWDEALFRFQEAEKLDPQNPHIQSNLGVAYEASGQFDKALERYKQALSLAPNDKDVRTNYARFVEFYQAFKGEKTTKADGTAKSGPANSGAPAGQPGGAQPEPPQPPSTPEDTPPPPADDRPPR